MTKTTTAGAAALALCLGAAGAGQASEDVHWDYEGEAAPENWGALTEDWAVCSTGLRQSPVDLTGGQDSKLEQVRPDWGTASGVTFVNNGHTLQANVPPGMSSTLNTRKYELLQFHFHHGSEHTVDGAQHPLEVHFVHKSEAGDLLVVGVFFEEGEENAALAPLWAAAPAEEGEAAIDGEVDIASFLPATTGQYRYAGSLTTPPCSEIVSWVVMAEPITASKEQIDAFGALFPNNFRPVQPLNQRMLFELGAN